MTLESIISNAREHPEQTAMLIKMWLKEKAQDYTGPEKAAFLMLSVKADIAKEVFCYLREDEIKKIKMEVERLEKIDLKQEINLLKEFEEKMEAKLSHKKDDTDYTRKLLGTRKP